MTLKDNLKTILNRFHQASVLVVGDVAIDEMVYGQTARMSREAPVLILKHDKTDILLGAAGNAAHNLASLGAKNVYLAGTYGQDDYKKHLQNALKRDGVSTEALVESTDRPTTTKTRISGRVRQSVQQQIVRIDRESTEPISAETEKAIIDKLCQLAPKCQAILLSDYDLGVITPKIIETCQKLAETLGIVWAVDSHRPLTLFKSATVATPNQPEAEENAGFLFETQADVEKAGLKILKETGLKNLLITQGGDGMTFFEGKNKIQHHIPVFNKSEVFDVTGAGDTVIATLTLALCSGASYLEASILGNLAASLVVRQFGTATTNTTEMIGALEKTDLSLFEKHHHLPTPKTVGA